MENSEFINILQKTIPYNASIDVHAYSVTATVSGEESGGLDNTIAVEQVCKVLHKIFIHGYIQDDDPNTIRSVTPDEITSGFEEIIEAVKSEISNTENANKTVHVITETVQDYKGACTNIYGVTESPEKASEILRAAIEERIDPAERFYDEEDPEQAAKDAKDFVEKHFTNEEKTRWDYFDGDTDYTFEIQKSKLL